MSICRVHNVGVAHDTLDSNTEQYVGVAHDSSVKSVVVVNLALLIPRWIMEVRLSAGLADVLGVLSAPSKQDAASNAHFIIRQYTFPSSIS